MSDIVVPPTCHSRADFVRALIDFVSGPMCARHTRPREPVLIDVSTPLFETGVVDSLGIIDLLAFVEMATGRRVPLREIDLRRFGTVDRIASSFWNTVREVGNGRR